MVTAYRPDIVIHNTDTSTVALLELTCPLDSDHHLEAARTRKATPIGNYVSGQPPASFFGEC